MDTTLYTRQEQLHLNIPNSVTVIGCGGVGARVAYELALAGVGSLFLFDHDMLEESNRNRLPFCQSSINRPKVEVTAEFIRAIRPGIIVVAVNDKLDGILLNIQLSVCSHFIDCTDSPKSQFAIYNACKKVGRTYIRTGYDYDTQKGDFHITVTSNVSGWIRTDVEEEHYAINPSYAVPAGVAALLAVEKLLRRHDQEVSLYLGDIGIPLLQKRGRRLTPRCNTGR